MSRVFKAIATFMLDFKNDPILIGVKPQSIVYYALNLISGDKIYDLKEVDAKMQSIAAEYDAYQNDTLKFQKKVLQMQQVYKELKDSINSSKN